MKILYHHRTASKDGQAVHIEEMIHALREQGHEVRVVAPTPHEESGGGQGGGMGGGSGDDGWVARLRAHLPKGAYELLELGYSLVAWRRLAAAAREFQPDVIYERYNLFMLAGLWAARRFKLPLLLEVNAPLVDERMRYGGLGLPRLARWAEDRVWRGADRVLPVTRVLGGHVTARGVPAERLAVIPNGINQAHFDAAPTPQAAKAALGWRADALVLGFTGFVRDWHGVDKVIRWMHGPDAPARTRLLIVGDGSARPELERLAAELGLTDRVHWTGYVDRAEVPGLVAAFDVALQPAAVAYASPLKLFEYLALAKAIIAPRQPNLEEVLADDENALLFDPAAPGAMEAALKRLCHDDALRARLAQAARDTITRQQLTWAHNARRVTALAQELVARRRGAAAAVAKPVAAAPRRSGH